MGDILHGAPGHYVISHVEMEQNTVQDHAIIPALQAMGRLAYIRISEMQKKVNIAVFVHVLVSTVNSYLLV